jgi:hypothetical protein
MKDVATELRDASRTLVDLNRRIHETFRTRDRSAADREVWSRACSEFHARFPALFYPGGASRWEAFLKRDSAELDAAVTFLEVDPMHFRSGYAKETIWTRMKAAELTPKQERRLEAVAIAYLHRQVRRDFWYMVRYVRFKGSSQFWEAVSALAEERAGVEGMKAWWLILARANYPVRNWINRELLRGRYQEAYVPKLTFGWRET